MEQTKYIEKYQKAKVSLALTDSKCGKSAGNDFDNIYANI